VSAYNGASRVPMNAKYKSDYNEMGLSYPAQ
jgi:hypothetical protein